MRVQLPNGVADGDCAPTGIVDCRGPNPTSAKRSGSVLVGVLGGMGPRATLDFLSKVIALTPAECDQDHLPLIIHHVPQIPDRSSAILRGTDEPYMPMRTGLQLLRRAGARVAVIPCNSAHHWYDRLAFKSDINILHIVDAVSAELQQHACSSGVVSLLATRGAVSAKIYEKRLKSSAKFMPVDEFTQCLIDQSINLTKAGRVEEASAVAEAAAAATLSRGADVLILGCTELPIALANSTFLLSCIDSTLALARTCLAYSRHRRAR